MTKRQNIADILTEEGRADIVKRFVTDKHPPVLTFIQNGDKVHYKVVAIKKGVWVKEVRLYRPEELDVTDV